MFRSFVTCRVFFSRLSMLSSHHTPALMAPTMCMGSLSGSVYPRPLGSRGRCIMGIWVSTHGPCVCCWLGALRLFSSV